MNPQKKWSDIGWTNVVCADGSVLHGFTWNPVAGCPHECVWPMPDGKMAVCYAKTIADGMQLRDQGFEQGFEDHYFHESRLSGPGKVKGKHGGIFTGSMGDMFAARVPGQDIRKVLDVMSNTLWHTYLTLTKYPVSLPRWNPFPPNVWTGISIPASSLKHKRSLFALRRQLFSFLAQLSEVQSAVRFISIEPLWWDVASAMEDYVAEVGKLPFEWAIIGAASVDYKHSQPKPYWTSHLLSLFDRLKIPVFFKSNMVWAQEDYRRDFPVWMPVESAPLAKKQRSMF